VCDEFRPARAPSGLLVMIRDGRLSRIAVTGAAGIRSEAGVRVGDPDAAVLAAVGDAAVVEPHKYVAAPARYVTVWRTAPPAPDARGVRYEIGEDGRVVRILAGDDAIALVEGCL
jgi:hypothetical protein